RSREIILDLRQPLSSARPAPLPGPVDLDTVARSPDAVISGVTLDEQSRSHVIYLHMPVRSDEQLAYVVTIALQPRAFQNILLPNAKGISVAAVVDREGRFIARSLNYEEW